MGVGVHTRCDAQLHVRCGQAFRTECIETVQFVEAVDDDVIHPGCDCQTKLVG